MWKITVRQDRYESLQDRSHLGIKARSQENGHTAVCFVPSEKTDTQATRPDGIRTATQYCAFGCQKNQARKAAKENGNSGSARHETACRQKAFCPNVALHCMCPPPSRRLCARLQGNLPWCRPVGPSWPLVAGRKVTPQGQPLTRRKYGFRLAAYTSLIQPHVLFVTFVTAHSSMNRRFREPPFDHLEPQTIEKLADGWPESEKDVFQAALSMVS